MTLPVAIAPQAEPVQSPSIAVGNPAWIDPALFDSISASTQDVLKSAAPALKSNINAGVDFSVGASEVAAKVALNAKVVTAAPSIAPCVAPCVDSAVDAAGAKLREAVHAQVELSIDERAPKVIDASVKSTGQSVNDGFKEHS